RDGSCPCQRDDEAVAAIISSHAACIASVALRDLAHQCQAQSSSNARAAAAAAIERLEYLFEFRFQGTWTVVPHRYNGGAVSASHPHLSGRGAVALGVFQQVA